MKKFSYLLTIISVFALIAVSCETTESTDSSDYALDKAITQKAAPEKCTTIQSGELVDSKGNTIEVGFDDWGYNYQAHVFNGYYNNYSRPDIPVTSGDKLIMKWNDAWLSNQDCDDDGLLDRHYGFVSYRGSGAWLTNHNEGTYQDSEGNDCHYTYFIKIVAAPTDATLDSGVWFNADGTEIGPVIWGQFAIIQEVSNDPCDDFPNGLQYNSPDHSGLGNW